jgi:2-polyprenyl-6-hydroxyphenyl methylase/3-demethylubiquinone-9 3-methyltransferase
VERKSINNDFYDFLNEDWYEALDHPIALLRAENQARIPWIIENIERHFKKTCSILDVGCGAGFLANALAKKGYTVTGIDISGKSLEIARKRDLTGNVIYRQENAYDLTINQEFDVVTAMDFLEHITDPQKVIQEMSRVLKPGGLFLFHTFNRNWISWLIALKGVEWFVKNTPKEMHVYHLFLKPQEVETYCQQASITVKRWVGLRPKFDWNFFKLLLTRSVPKEFSFEVHSSLKCGYMGIGLKT